MRRIARRGLCAVLALLPLTAAALDVRLHKRDCGCDGREGPRTREEERKIDWRWLGPEQLEVQVWSTETAQSPVDEASAWIELENSKVQIGHERRTITALSPDGDLTCLFTLRLTYTIDGLPRGRYSLHAARADTVQVEP